MGPVVISQWEVGTDRNVVEAVKEALSEEPVEGAGPLLLRPFFLHPTLLPSPQGCPGLTEPLIPVTSGGGVGELSRPPAQKSEGKCRGILFSGLVLLNVQVDTTSPPLLLLHTLSWFFFSCLFLFFSTLPSVWGELCACKQGNARDTVRGVSHLRTLEHPLGTWFIPEDTESLKGRRKEWVCGDLCPTGDVTYKLGLPLLGCWANRHNQTKDGKEGFIITCSQ